MTPVALRRAPYHALMRVPMGSVPALATKGVVDLEDVGYSARTNLDSII